MFRFRISPVLVLMTVAACAAALWRLDKVVFWVSVFGMVAANGLGVLVGLFVTYVLRFPNDGSLSWDSEDPHDDTQ